MHARLKDSSVDTTILTHALKVLATHGWHKTEDASFGVEAVQALAKGFTIPLQEAGVNCALLEHEWEDMVYYAKEYINLVQDPYRVVWWKLFNSPDANKWTNILTLVELIFCIHYQMVMLKDASHSLNSPRQTERLPWERIDWIKFAVSELKALPLSNGILAMLWDYGGQTK